MLAGRLDSHNSGKNWVTIFRLSTRPLQPRFDSTWQRSNALQHYRCHYRYEGDEEEYFLIALCFLAFLIDRTHCPYASFYRNRR